LETRDLICVQTVCNTLQLLTPVPFFLISAYFIRNVYTYFLTTVNIILHLDKLLQSIDFVLTCVVERGTFEDPACGNVSVLFFSVFTVLVHRE
jgi:hypothetical protein